MNNQRIYHQHYSLRITHLVVITSANTHNPDRNTYIADSLSNQSTSNPIARLVRYNCHKYVALILYSL